MEWWQAAGIRALKTVAQTAAASLAVASYLEDVKWQALLSAAILAGLLSLITSVAGLPEVEEDD